MAPDTDQELALLAADELPDGSRVWTTHFFAHFGSTYEQHAAFHAALRAAGFGTPGKHVEIGADEELEGDGFWHHWAFTVFDADPETLREADARAREVAAAHGVRYDGWMVSRNLLTGAPHAVEQLR